MKYSLTERQMDMLRLIAPSLEDGTISGHWIYRIGGGRIETILSIGGRDIESPERHIEWKDISLGDFKTFADFGLIRLEHNGSQGTIYPYVQKIIDAVKSDFGEDEQSDTNSKSNALAFTPIWETPIATNQFKADIFVMMPFKPEMKRVYDDCMKPTAQSLNLSINRGDDFFTKHPIVKDIWSAIYHCRLVIADCTGRNANVFYELGMTHTVGKPVILIAQNADDIPFDIHHYRHIIYNNTPEGLIKLVDELKSAIPKILDT
jgi:hypothetical protein